jgi:hypothetical protein
MPTELPTQRATVAAAKNLSWPDVVRLLILMTRVRWLNRRLEAARYRVDQHGLDVAGTDLVIIARRWLAAQEAVADLLGLPERAEVAKVRATLSQRQSRRRP